MSEEYKVKCPSCGREMKIFTYDYRPIGGVAVFGYCPYCNVVKGIMAEGMIPNELAKNIFPSHTEVF